MPKEILPIRLEFKDIPTNLNLTLALTTPNVGWSIGKDYIDSSGISFLGDENTQQFISRIAVSYSLLSISTIQEATSAATNPINFAMSLFLVVYDKARILNGFASLSTEGQVLYNIGNELSGVWKNGFLSASW